METTHKHPMKPEMLKFVLAAEKNNDGASFTVVSKKTGKDFTYKISRSSFAGKFYTHVYIEQNYLEFKRLGSYFRGLIWAKNENGKNMPVKTLAADSIAYILQKVEEQKFDLLDSQIEILHLGNCLRCGATLTDAKSIEIGLGPVCRKF